MTLPVILIFTHFRVNFNSWLQWLAQGCLVLFDLSLALNPRSCVYRGFRRVGYGMGFSIR